MAFIHAGRGKTCLLKVPVHIAGEDEAALRHALRPGMEQAEARVRRGGAVQVEPVAVEAPGGGRALLKGVRRGDALERQPLPAQRGVGAPEAAVAPEVGQAGVDAHARARRDDQRLGVLEQVRGAGQFVLQQKVGGPVGIGADVPGIGLGPVFHRVARQGFAQGDGVLVAYAQAALQEGDAGVVGVQHVLPCLVVQRIAGRARGALGRIRPRGRAVDRTKLMQWWADYLDAPGQSARAVPRSRRVVG